MNKKNPSIKQDKKFELVFSRPAQLKFYHRRLVYEGQNIIRRIEGKPLKFYCLRSMLDYELRK